MESLFIADLHLKISDSAIPYLNFIDFLNTIKDYCKNLYILGDLFSYWYEHPVVDFYSRNPGLKAIKEFRKSGSKIYFIIGNRDFMAADLFQKYSNIDFIGDELTINSGNKKLYLTHGDKFVKKDIRYQIWRRFVRSPLAGYVFKRLPVGYAISIADKFKRVGKRMPIAEKIIASMITNEAVNQFRKNYDVIITGHAHLKTGRSYNIDGKLRELFILPEFEFPGEFLTLENGKLEYRNIG